MMRRTLGLILVLSIIFMARLASADDWEEGWMKEVRGVEPPPKVCQMIYDHDWPTKEGLELPGAREKEAEFNRSIARELVDVLRSHDRAVRERTCPEFFPRGFMDTADIAEKIFLYLRDAGAKPADIGLTIGGFRTIVLEDYRWQLADLRTEVMRGKCTFTDCIGGVYDLAREATSSGELGWNFKPEELGLLDCEAGETCTRDDFVKLANAGPQKE